MTLSTRSTIAILGLLCATLAPAGAGAQVHMKSAATTRVDGLTAQEREMLALATDLAQRCSATLEKWTASKEITEEKLFATLYYPMPKTSPPRYNTDWDRLSDRDILGLEEAVLTRSSAILFAILIDKNGYVPSHNRRFAQPLTGNRAVDLVNSRTKMINLHQTSLAAAHNQAAFLFQRYPRDTGEVIVDLSVPVLVHGVHWGAVRIGYRPLDSN
jgi:methyl-accepting chemotaxis protein